MRIHWNVLLLWTINKALAGFSSLARLGGSYGVPVPYGPGSLPGSYRGPGQQQVLLLIASPVPYSQQPELVGPPAISPPEEQREHTTKVPVSASSRSPDAPPPPPLR